MPVTNLVDVSPHLTYDNTVTLLAEAYAKRMGTSKVDVYYLHIIREHCTYQFSCSNSALFQKNVTLLLLRKLG